jgi:hypothetical protein
MVNFFLYKSGYSEAYFEEPLYGTGGADVA